MPTDIRYKFTKNTTGAAIETATAFVAENTSSDGDGKQRKVVRRILTAADIGTDEGQVGHANGLIVDVIPKTYNILFVQLLVWRKSSSDVGTTGMYTYDLVQNQMFHSGGAVTGETLVVHGVMPSDNSIRVIDKDPNSAVVGVKLEEGDVIIADIFLGQAEDPLDLINYP
jgi:hypothetical protein